MNQKIINGLYIFLIVSVVAFMLFVIFWLKGESKQCVNQPFIYAAKKLQNNFECECTDRTGTIYNFNTTNYKAYKNIIEQKQFLNPNWSIDIK